MRRKRRFIQFERIFPFTKCDGKCVLFHSKEFSLLRNATEKAFCSIPKNFSFYEMRRKRRFVQFQRIFPFTKCDGKGVLFNSKEFLLLGNATEKAFCSIPKNFSFYEMRRKRRFVQFQRIFPFTKCDGKGVLFNSKEFSPLRNATKKAFCSIPKNFFLHEMLRKRRFVQFQRIFLFTKCDEKGVLFNSKEFSSLRNATKK